MGTGRYTDLDWAIQSDTVLWHKRVDVPGKGCCGKRSDGSCWITVNFKGVSHCQRFFQIVKEIYPGIVCSTSIWMFVRL